MKVRLERTFPMPAGADASWAVLSDIEAVAGCVPGAKVTEKLDDTHYKGTVAVKLGPANLSFRGEIEVLELSAETRTLRLMAKGTDTTGSSFASMDLTARVDAAADGTSTLVGNSEATVGGKVAAFGSRMMDAVSDQILKQFGANFTARVAASAEPAAQAGAPAEALSAAGSGASPASAPGAGRGPSPESAPAPSLNGLALLWAIIREWFRGLFSKKAS